MSVWALLDVWFIAQFIPVLTQVVMLHRGRGGTSAAPSSQIAPVMHRACSTQSLSRICLNKTKYAHSSLNTQARKLGNNRINYDWLRIDHWMQPAQYSLWLLHESQKEYDTVIGWPHHLWVTPLDFILYRVWQPDEPWRTASNSNFLVRSNKCVVGSYQCNTGLRVADKNKVLQYFFVFLFFFYFISETWSSRSEHGLQRLLFFFP